MINMKTKSEYIQGLKDREKKEKEKESPIGPCGERCKSHVEFGCKGCVNEGFLT